MFHGFVPHRCSGALSVNTGAAIASSITMVAEPTGVVALSCSEQSLERMAAAGPAAAARDFAQPNAEPRFTVPVGFQVERLFVVPKDELGLSAYINTDPQSRLIFNDAPAPASAFSDPGKGPAAKTSVEAR